MTTYIILIAIMAVLLAVGWLFLDMPERFYGKAIVASVIVGIGLLAIPFFPKILGPKPYLPTQLPEKVLDKLNM